ncbi:MAG TPA: thiamine pyrophosphate-dependent enzyme, partial [Limnochordia bacterium]|nr:thiamine pyrophosphate-dependent enzyme [Limnochordia bacterium]
LIVAGGGVIYAEASGELDAFVKAFGVPSAETQAGKGALPWNHPQNAGPLGSNGGLAANRLAAQADLVIALGTRLSDFTSASKSAFQHPNVRFIGINVSAFDAAKFGALALVGDARATLHVLAEALGSAGYRTEPAYAAQLAAWKAEWDAAVDAQRAIADPAHLTQANVIGLVNDAAGERDVVICAAGGMPGDLLKLWRPLDPKSYHLEYGYSCMGYEIAGGLGAKLADPSREVFVMVGDGSYLMLHTELVTAVQEGVKLIVVVVDNHGYQCIHGLQNASGSPSFGNEFRQRAPGNGRLEGEFVTVDFVANAQSLGAESLAAHDARELRAALEAAKASPRTTVIHVQVPADVRVPGYESWWDVPIAEVSKQEGVRQARAEYVAAKARQRRF